MHNGFSRAFALVIACLSSVGCGGQAAPAAAPPAAEPPSVPPAAPEAAKPAQPAAPAGPSIDDPTFELAATPVGTYASGKPGSVAITLKPRGIYHVNQEYPISIALTAPPALTLAKTELQKSEAAEVTEKIARFDVPVTPKEAGTHTLEAKVKFAVCTPENCVPDERTLALALTVQ